MARPAFAGRRARSRLGQLAAFAAVAMLVAAALAVLGGAILPVLDAGAREVVRQSGATASAMRIDTRIDADPVQQDDELRAAIQAALRKVPAEVTRSVTVGADALPAGAVDPVAVQLLADPELPRVADLVSGSWPSSAGEAAIQDAAAAALSLRVGDTLAIGPHEVVITGTWHARDASAARWFGDPAVASGAEGGSAGPLLVDETVTAGLDDTPRVRWTIVPGAEALTATGLPSLADALARLDTEVSRMGGGDTAVSLDGTLDQTVARATRLTAVATGVLGLPIVLVVVAGAIVLALIARAIASGRGGEFVLLRARGASLRALAAASTREAGVAAVIGAAAGVGLAVPVLAVGLPWIGASGSGSLVAMIGIAAGVALLAVTLSLVVTSAELRAPVTQRAEAGRAAVVAALGPLALVAVVAGLALAQFLTLGSPVVVRSDGVVRTDPVALTAPVLVLLTGALAAPAIAGPIVALAERLARAGRGILPVLPLRQLARRTRSVAAGVLVVALASGALVMAGAFQSSAAELRQRVERAATGADLRILLPVRSSIEETSAAASMSLLAGVAAIDDGFAVLGSTASTANEGVSLVAADAERLAEAPSAPPELAGEVGALTAARGGSPLPAGTEALVVSATLLPGEGVPQGREFDVLLWLADGDGSALRVPFGTASLVGGQVELTGAIPADATTILAVEFRPPALPPGTAVDIELGGVRTPDGTAVAFAGEPTRVMSGKPVRFLPQPDSADPLPVAVGAQFAERFGIVPGTAFTFRVGSVPAPIPAEVAAVLPSLPGTSGSLGIVLDLLTLESRAVGLGGSVPAANQLWLTARDPDAAAAGARGVLTQRAEIVTPRTLSPAPVLVPTVVLLAFGVGVTALLAVLGFATVAAAIGQRRTVELTPLRSLGLSPARIRRARAIELVATAVLALLLGAAAGVATAALVVPGLTGVLS